MRDVGRHREWASVRLGVCFNEVDERVGDGDAGVLLSVSQYQGVVRRESLTSKPPSASDFSKYKRCRVGDIVLNRFNAYRGSLGVAAEAGIVSPDYLVLRPISANPFYVEYLLRSHHLSSLMKQTMGGIGAADPDSSGFSRIDTRELFRFDVSLPEPSEQTEVAAFLDRETAEIDAFIADQEELIGLLAERRAATISHAVTKGLDPTVPMKDSGIGWLGEVPEHWQVRSIRSLSAVKRGASPRPIDDPVYFDDDGIWSWVRIQDVTASDGFLVETAQRLSTLGASLSVKLSPGALFLSIAGSVGKPCIAGIKCCIHDGFVYFPALGEAISGFLFRAFESGQPFLGLGKLGTQLNLNTDTVGGVSIAIPPLREIAEILANLEVRLSELDATIADARDAIALSRERRAALISAAVTGKIDVRGAA